MNTSLEKYNTEWFKKRALDSLEKIDTGYWDYSDSLLIYSLDGQNTYESAQEDNSPYFKLVTTDKLAHLKFIAANVANILPQKFEYLDLGPGTENSIFLEEFKKQNKDFLYIPVDVSSHFLDVASKNASKFNIDTRPVQSSFEELPDTLEKSASPRFVSLLGLTFYNYQPSKILNLLSRIAGKNSYILIDTQLSDRVDLHELKTVYQKYATPACDKKISLLGLDPAKDVSKRITDEQISITCSLININKTLKDKGLKVGDKIKIFQSLRKTRSDFENDLKDFDYIIFDTKNSFLSAVIKT